MKNPGLRELGALEDQIHRARVVLQRTNDQHPEFEERVQNLVRLSEALDDALCAGSWRKQPQ